MTAELQLLLERMSDRLEAIDTRTRAIETHVAEKAGERKVKATVFEGVRWLIAIGVAFAAGHWPHAQH